MKNKKVVAALEALAQATRLAIYRLLVQRGPEGMAAGAVAEKLDLPASSLSFHLHHLRRGGLITQERRSRQLIYAANFEVMNRLVGYLTENCCGQGATTVPACTPAANRQGATREASGHGRRR